MNIDENLFYQCKDDQHGNLTLSDFQENGGAKRKGYILAFPKKIMMKFLIREPGRIATRYWMLQARMFLKMSSNM